MVSDPIASHPHDRSKNQAIAIAAAIFNSSKADRNSVPGHVARNFIVQFRIGYDLYKAKTEQSSTIQDCINELRQAVKHHTQTASSLERALATTTLRTWEAQMETLQVEIAGAEELFGSLMLQLAKDYLLRYSIYTGLLRTPRGKDLFDDTSIPKLSN